MFLDLLKEKFWLFNLVEIIGGEDCVCLLELGLGWKNFSRFFGTELRDFWLFWVIVF